MSLTVLEPLLTGYVAFIPIYPVHLPEDIASEQLSSSFLLILNLLCIQFFFNLCVK